MEITIGKIQYDGNKKVNNNSFGRVFTKNIETFNNL